MEKREVTLCNLGNSYVEYSLDFFEQIQANGNGNGSGNDIIGEAAPSECKQYYCLIYRHVIGIISKQNRDSLLYLLYIYLLIDSTGPVLELFPRNGTLPARGTQVISLTFHPLKHKFYSFSGEKKNQ